MYASHSFTDPGTPPVGPGDDSTNPLDNASFDPSSDRNNSAEQNQDSDNSKDIVDNAREQMRRSAENSPTRQPDIHIEVASNQQAFEAIEALQQDIWSFTDREILPHFFQDILVNTGSVILIAYDKSEVPSQSDQPDDADPTSTLGRPVGFSISILSRDSQTSENYLHMDLLGVHPDFQSSGIGMKLQAHLRQHALDSGIDLVRGTFDPMETRNAKVYLNGIGAKVIAFERNYYGSDYATEYEQLESHRYTASWYLENTGAPEFPDTSTQLVDIQPDGTPSVDVAELSTDRDHYICSVPTNFREIKEQDLDLAQTWQDAIADVSEALIGRGYEIRNFRMNKESGYGEYLFLKKGGAPEPWLSKSV